MCFFFIFRSLKKHSMNPNTVLCTHNCANGSMRMPQTLNHQNVRLPPSSACCLANAKMNSKIALLFPQLTRKEPENSPTTRRRRDLWQSGRCLAISSSSANSASWKCYTTPFCTGKYLELTLFLFRK